MKILFVSISAASIASLKIGDYILGKVGPNKWIAAKVIKLGRKYITGQYYDKAEDKFEEAEAFRIDRETFNRLKLNVVSTKEAKYLEKSASKAKQKAAVKKPYVVGKMPKNAWFTEDQEDVHRRKAPGVRISTRKNS